MTAPCQKCQETNGLFIYTEDGKMDRCTCRRGMELRASDAARVQGAAAQQPPDPLVSEESAMAAVESMSSIPYFPASELARGLIGAELRSICRSDGEMMWLIKRMVRLYRQWPGIPEIRAVYCSRFRPLDGIEGGGSDVYPDGVPSELPAADPVKMLKAGTTDPQLSAAIDSLALAKRVKK